MEPESTPDGRYIIVNGRKWRATDPNIPGALKSQLVNELMRGRREVKARGDAARFIVQDAKVALGERGEPWWEPTAAGRRERMAAVMRAILRGRDGKTMCPSEAARTVGGDTWRDLMDDARAVAYELHEQGVLEVRQKGERVEPADVKGAIRLAPGPKLER